MAQVGGVDLAGGEDAGRVDAQHLQPDECVTDDELLDAHDDEAVLRRLNDQQLRDALATEGFAGKNYDRWREDMARYAIAVLNAWIYTGYIFKLCKDRGYGLACDDASWDALRKDKELRNDLAVMTVARTFNPFRERSLITGEWTAEAGASLTTYFMGATLYQFPNTFRAFLKDRGEDLLRRRTEDNIDQLRVRSGPLSTEAHALGALAHHDLLSQFPPRTQTILKLRAAGYLEAEIAEIVGDTSEKAIEGVLYRVRTRLNPQHSRRRSQL